MKVPDMEIIYYGQFKQKEVNQEKGNAPGESQEATQQRKGRVEETNGGG